MTDEQIPVFAFFLGLAVGVLANVGGGLWAMSRQIRLAREELDRTKAETDAMVRAVKKKSEFHDLNVVLKQIADAPSQN